MHRIIKNIKKQFVGSIILLSIFSLQSCIENDIPYPFINLYITDLDVEGLLSRPVISNDERTVTLNIDETANLKKILVKRLSITDGAKSSLSVGDHIDLSRTQWVNLSLYQDVQWKIIGNQTIQRAFRINNQVGVATYDIVNKVAYANIIKEDNSLAQAQPPQLLELKLGPQGSTINNISTLPNVTWNWEKSFWSTKVVVNYQHYDEPEEWILYVFPTSSVSTLTRVDGWVNVAWLYGEGLEGGDNGFEIRETTSNDWTKIDKSTITNNGGGYSARVAHLKAETSYTVRAYSGDNVSSESTFITGKELELPNGSFDDWHKVGRVWNPWLENGTPIWDTGNDGTTTLGESNSQPSSDIRPGALSGSQAAKLESKFVGLAGIGKFGAGNLFIGEFKRVDGTNGVLDFGKPFTARPTKLKGYYKYTTAPINYASSDFEALRGKPDTCSIYIVLGDWTEPVEIRTNPNNPKYFDKNDPRIIAYAELNSGSTVQNYTQFELELDYRATNRIPTYLLVVCSASKYGDYFTGGGGAVLYVDDFSLEYDY